jgi:hypothetical protein
VDKFGVRKRIGNYRFDLKGVPIGNGVEHGFGCILHELPAKSLRLVRQLCSDRLTDAGWQISNFQEPALILAEYRFSYEFFQNKAAEYLSEAQANSVANLAHGSHRERVDGY